MYNFLRMLVKYIKKQGITQEKIHVAPRPPSYIIIILFGCRAGARKGIPNTFASDDVSIDIYLLGGI